MEGYYLYCSRGSSDLTVNRMEDFLESNGLDEYLESLLDEIAEFNSSSIISLDEFTSFQKFWWFGLDSFEIFYYNIARMENDIPTNESVLLNLTVLDLESYLNDQGLYEVMSAASLADSNHDHIISLQEFKVFEDAWWFGVDVRERCICSQESFSVRNCSSDHNASCIICSECAEGQFVSKNCTSFHDTTCNLCSTCPAKVFYLSNCSYFTDAKCASSIIQSVFNNITLNKDSLTVGAMESFLVSQGLSWYIGYTGLDTYSSDYCIDIDMFTEMFQNFWWFGKDVANKCLCNTYQFQEDICSETVRSVKCAACRECSAGLEYMAVQCTQFSNSECSNCSSCEVGKFKLRSCGLHNDSVCSVCTPCNNGEYSVASCEGNLDNVCAICSVCDKDQYYFKNCTLLSNTLCDVLAPALVEFTVVLPETKDEFQDQTEEYIVAIGETIFEETLVQTVPLYASWSFEEKYSYYSDLISVGSVTQGSSRRRSLLAIFIDVVTVVSVKGPKQAAAVSSAINKTDFLDSKLSLYGLPDFLSISTPQVPYHFNTQA